MKKSEDDEWLCPCKKCGGIPHVVDYDGLFYVFHKGTIKKTIRKKVNGENVRTEIRVPCDKWPKYEFCSVSEAAAIRNWYWANMHGCRDIDDIWDS